MPFFKSKQWKSEVRLDGKTVIITGANTGIGKETARDLVGRGARVILACRDVAKAQTAADDIAQNDPDKLKLTVVRKLDLASMTSIRQFVAEILEAEPKIHILINNAGIFCPQTKTEDGFEMQFGVNHLGHFLLTNLLLDRLKESAPARIVIVSSLGHVTGKINFEDLMLENNYGTLKAYCQSKLANVLMAKELSKRLKDTGVTTYSLHPGAVETELQRHIPEIVPSFIAWISRKTSSLMRTPTEGAQTSIYCAVAEELQDKTGLYYSDCKEKQSSSRSRDEETARKLWSISCSLVGIDDTEIAQQENAAIPASS